MSQTSYLSSHYIHKHQFAVRPYLALIIWSRWLFMLYTRNFLKYIYKYKLVTFNGELHIYYSKRIFPRIKYHSFRFLHLHTQGGVNR